MFKIKKLLSTLLICMVLLFPATGWLWPVGYDSVGVLYTSDGGGSCVKTTKGVYSAKHILHEGDVRHNFKVLRVYKTLDLMVIRLTDKQKLKAARVAKHIDPDKPIYCIGWFAGGRQKVAVPGHIIGKITERYARSISNKESDFTEAIMVDLEIIPGMSGGGCFQDGKLIGIVSSSMVLCKYDYRCDGQLFSIMIPIPGVGWKDEVTSSKEKVHGLENVR